MYVVVESLILVTSSNRESRLLMKPTVKVDRVLGIRPSPEPSSRYQIGSPLVPEPARDDGAQYSSPLDQRLV